jgi:hypothetical protein
MLGSEFIFANLVKIPALLRLIFDPCSGMGSLLKPWARNGYRT